MRRLWMLSIIGWAATGSGAEWSLPVERHRLENGMVILTVEDHSAPVATLFLFYRVGSRNERPGLTGLSHYFEHMAFNGATKYGPKEFDYLLESHGGYSNAFTSNDMTAYYEDFAAPMLPLVFDLEGDRMRGLRFDPEIMESERNVVAEERRLMSENDPVGAVIELLFATAYLAHPYGWPVIGWAADIASYTRADCLDYFATYYAPNNAIVVLSGDFHTAEALRLAREHFGALPPGPPPRAVVRSEPPQRGERRAELRMPAHVPVLAAGYRVPPADSPDGPVLETLRAVLADGESSRLYRRLVLETEIALEVHVDYFPRLDPNLFSVFLQVHPDSSPAAAERQLYDELARLVREGVSAAELAKAKNKLETGFYRELKTNNGRALQLGLHELLYGDYRTLFAIPGRYRAVTPADLQRVAAATFAAANRSVVTLRPEPPAEGS